MTLHPRLLLAFAAVLMGLAVTTTVGQEKGEDDLSAAGARYDCLVNKTNKVLDVTLVSHRATTRHRVYPGHMIHFQLSLDVKRMAFVAFEAGKKDTIVAMKSFPTLHQQWPPKNCVKILATPIPVDDVERETNDSHQDSQGVPSHTD